MIVIGAGNAAGIVSDLGWVFVVATTFGFIAHFIRIPPLLGFIVAGAGFANGWFGEELLSRPDTLMKLSELGVIFLMFFIGMEFDLERLKRIFAPALIAVGLQTLAMVFLGVQVAAFLGWSPTQGLFLGALFSISSSMVAINVINERNEMQLPRAQLAMGALIFEDILAIILLVILTGLAVDGRFNLDATGIAVSGVGLFVVASYFVGRLVIVKVLDYIEKQGRTEYWVLFAIGVMLGEGLLAAHFDFSLALGAFLAGAIMAGTRQMEQIERAIEPLRILFGALFFVSVGMRVEPQEVINGLGLSLVVSILIILGKTFTVWFGFVIAGQRSSSSFKGSLVKSQIGEFGFIIAALGIDLGVAGAEMMNLAVGVALITIIFTPILAKAADPLFEWIDTHTPSGVRTAGKAYTDLLTSFKRSLENKKLLVLLRRPTLQIVFSFIVVNAVVAVAYILAGVIENTPELDATHDWWRWGIWLLAGVACLPLIISILRNVNAIVMMLTKASFQHTGDLFSLGGRTRNAINGLIMFMIVPVFGIVYFGAAASFLPRGTALIAFAAILITTGLVFWNRLIAVNSQLERAFFDSLNQQQATESAKQRKQLLSSLSKHACFSVELEDYTIVAASEPVTRRINQLGVREATGAAIVGIGRDGSWIYNPPPEAILFAGDHIILAGTNRQLQQAKRHLGKAARNQENSPQTRPDIARLLIEANSELEGNTLAGLDLRHRFGVTALGIQRGDNWLSPPKPDDLILSGDVLVLIGGKHRLNEITPLAHHRDSIDA
ncbi:MAG: cation:proton antiporter [Opitutales bacterium]|nr:cation:proton antiporter [Opitutales bacterium]